VGTVFDGKTKVGRAVADPKTDRSLPQGYSLSLSQITTKTALGGTVGARCTLVHGDQYDFISATVNVEVIGDLFTNISGNETHSVLHNRTETITQNNTLSVGGNQNWTITGQYMSLFVGPKTDVHVSPLSLLHSATQCTSEPQPKMHILGVEFEKKDSEFTFCTNSFDINVIANEINLAFKNELTTLNNEVKVILDFATVLGVSIEPKVAEVELKALKTFLGGGEAEVAAGKATVAAGVNAVPGVPTSHQ
jgi:hypothetical protein